MVKLAGKLALERRERRWEDNVKINIKKVGWSCVDVVIVTQNSGKWRAVVNTVIKILCSSTCGEFVDQVRNYKILKKNPILWR
jgi:hypothetical protein